jgi:mono/diheme cytochrome c family protein
MRSHFSARGPLMMKTLFDTRGLFEHNLRAMFARDCAALGLYGGLSAGSVNPSAHSLAQIAQCSPRRENRSGLIYPQADMAPRAGVVKRASHGWRRLPSMRLGVAVVAVLALPFSASAAAPQPLSPTAVVVARDGGKVFVACATAGAVVVLDSRGATLQQIKMPGPPSGLALSADGGRLAVTCAAPQSTVCIVDLARGAIVAQFTAGHTATAPVFSPDGGTLYVSNRFNHDATLCFQTWQSCSSCHSHDGRVDGLNWDLLNDGIGNPKNAKSLVWAHQTPPAMSTGVRATAEVAVRAGIRHSLFAVLPDEVPEAIDEYLKSLAPAPSPYLENGTLSRSAQRGKRIFEDPKVACASCHPPGLFTDLQKYDVGTRRQRDGAGTLFDTPTLVELWRSAPYLHDGSARTIPDVLIQQNPRDKHGATSHLTEQQINDLATYVLSL